MGFTPAQDALQVFIESLDVPFEFWQVQSVHIEADSNFIRIGYFPKASPELQVTDAWKKFYNNNVADGAVVMVHSVVRRVQPKDEDNGSTN